MKPIRKNKEDSGKRGKGNKEEGPSRQIRDPGDLGDSRGSRGKNATPQKIEEKGDKRRIQQDSPKPKKRPRG